MLFHMYSLGLDIWTSLKHSEKLVLDSDYLESTLFFSSSVVVNKHYRPAC